MSALTSILTLLAYEWKRALARKKILIVIVLTALFEVIPFVVLTQVDAPIIQSILRQFSDLMWLVGVLLPQGLFIHVIAVLVASGSMAEEYEQGTVDILVSKPITRMEYLTGKYLGGFTLMALVSLFLVVLGIVLAEVSFGPQRYLEYAPVIYAAITFTTLLYYSIGFMLGEVFRRSTLAYLTASTLLIMSVVTQGILVFIYSLTGDAFYLQVDKALPAWSVTNLPQMVATELFLGGRALLPLPQMGLQVGGTILEAVAVIAIYAVISVAVSALRFTRSDISAVTS